MLDMPKIAAHLDALRAQGAAALNIPALSAWLRQAFSGLDYAALRAFADREADPAATRYSMGQNMGYLGYYAPSDVRLRITTNMRRGRLTRVRGNNDCYIYEYGKDGALLRILMPDTSTATYHFAGEGLRCFASFAPYTRSDAPGICNIVLARYDGDGYPKIIVDALYDGGNMEQPWMEIDVDEPPRDGVQTCWLLTVGEDPRDGALLRFLTGVRVHYGEKRKIVDWDMFLEQTRL